MAVGEAGDGSAVARWSAGAGAFVVSLDSMVNVAFPSIAAAFGVAPEQMRWVIICYLFTYAIVSFAAGAVGDHVGHARVYRLGLALSAVGFVACGLASRFGALLAGRVVQGFAAGLVYGTAPGLVTLASPPARRGRAVGFFNAAVALAFTAGPLVSGLLLGSLGWRAIFHVRIPLVLGVLAWATVALPPSRARLGRASVSFRDLGRRPIVMASALAFLANAGIFAVWLLAPFYLIGRRGLDPWAGGLVFMLSPLGTTLAAPAAGRLADRLGPRPLVVGGLLLEAVGLGLVSRAGATTPMLLVALALLAAGLGLGLFQVPNMAGLMGAFTAARQGVAGGLAFLARTLGVATGVLGLAFVFGRGREVAGFDAAFASAFLVAAGAVAAAAVLALVDDRRTA